MEIYNNITENREQRTASYVNRIVLGDSYKLIKEIEDKSIDCIYVDVPYLYETGGAGKSELSNRAAKSKMELQGVGKLFDNSRTPTENLRIAKNKKNASIDLLNSNITDGFEYRYMLKEFFRVMKKCNLYIWCSQMQILDLMNEIHKYIDSTITILCWCKTNPIPTTNNLWLSDIEYCLYVRDSGIRLNDGYGLKSKFYVSAINQKDKEKYKHPTIKPLELVKRHILHSTQPNDIVLDCFSGSGTTCVACKDTGRRYIGFEIDPEYYKISIDRLNGILANGQISFDTDISKI